MKEVHAPDYHDQLFPMGKERAGAHRLLWKIVGFSIMIFLAVTVIGAAFA